MFKTLLTYYLFIKAYTGALKMNCSETRRSSVLQLLFHKFPVKTSISCVVFSLLTAPSHTPLLKRQRSLKETAPHS